MKETIHDAVNRKRDNIVRSAHTVQLPPEFQQAVEQLEDYLRAQKRRSTVERRYVLEVLYGFDAPVDVTTIYQQVTEQKGHVSLTTVYNTLQLLEELHLARRIDLVSHGMTFFERSLGQEPRGYVVCNECGQIKPIRHPGLVETCSPLLPKGFQPDGYTFIIHGLCSKCQKARGRGRKPRATKPKTTTQNRKTKNK